MANDGPQGPLMRTRDVAEHLAVSMSTLERWRHDGEGPEHARLPSGRVRYYRSAVEAFVNELD